MEFNKKLNKLYKETPAFYQIEDSWDGFNWISADEKDNNVISFIRSDLSGNQVVVICNFSGNDYLSYRLGLDGGTYKLILNTDEKRFGGNGILKGKTFKTVKRNAHGKKTSIRFNLPRFSALYFIKVD